MTVEPVSLRPPSQTSSRATSRCRLLNSRRPVAFSLIATVAAAPAASRPEAVPTTTVLLVVRPRAATATSLPCLNVSATTSSSLSVQPLPLEQLTWKLASTPVTFGRPSLAELAGRLAVTVGGGVGVVAVLVEPVLDELVLAELVPVVVPVAVVVLVPVVPVVGVLVVVVPVLVVVPPPPAQHDATQQEVHRSLELP